MERREWSAYDAPALEAEGIHFDHDDDTRDALLLAKRFGDEISERMPDEPGVWALDKECVFAPWVRRKGETRWACLRCYGTSCWDSAIRETFMAALREGV